MGGRRWRRHQVLPFGVFVRVEEAENGFEGLVHISELADEHVDGADIAVQVGDLPVKILDVDPTRAGSPSRTGRLSRRPTAVAFAREPAQLPTPRPAMNAAGYRSPRAEPRRNGLLDLGEVVRGEVHVQRGQRLGQPLAGAGADERHDVLALCGHPGDDQLGRVRRSSSSATRRRASTRARLCSTFPGENRG
ncbi:hypothetical protein SCYAM73S_00477 [Streptomyces cyaneofuscatus]